MNAQTNALSESLEAQQVAPRTLSVMHPFYWSLRRELWENRWIYVGQLAIAAVFLIVFPIHMAVWVSKMRTVSANDASRYWEMVALPFNIGAGVMMGTLILMSLFYSADALYGERRDRSILFWKSLPVSDISVVLAKASIPLVILPLLTMVVTIIMHVIMLGVSSIVLPARGLTVAPVWRELSIFQMWGMLAYHIFLAHAIWPFPIYCWLMLVSGWARRATLLWAALPVVAIAGIEKLVFHTAYFVSVVGYRIIGGGAPTDITSGEMLPTGPMTHLTPARYLSAPGLWIGLAVAAVFLIAAVRMRRYRGPI